MIGGRHKERPRPQRVEILTIFTVFSSLPLRGTPCLVQTQKTCSHYPNPTPISTFSSGTTFRWIFREHRKHKSYFSSLSEFTVCWGNGQISKLSLKTMLCAKTEMWIELGGRNVHKSGCYLCLSGKASWKRCCLIKRAFLVWHGQLIVLNCCFSVIVCCSSPWADCLCLEE